MRGNVQTTPVAPSPAPAPAPSKPVKDEMKPKRGRPRKDAKKEGVSKKEEVEEGSDEDKPKKKKPFVDALRAKIEALCPGYKFPETSPAWYTNDFEHTNNGVTKKGDGKVMPLSCYCKELGVAVMHMVPDYFRRRNEGMEKYMVAFEKFKLEKCAKNGVTLIYIKTAVWTDEEKATVAKAIEAAIAAKKASPSSTGNFLAPEDISHAMDVDHHYASSSSSGSTVVIDLVSDLMEDFAFDLDTQANSQ